MNYTTQPQTDGFGAQYQKIIQTYIFCKIHKLIFLYRPFEFIEHNYNNDGDFIQKVEEFINLKNNIANINNNDINSINYGSVVMKYYESNIDTLCRSEHLEFIKNCFWAHKEKDFFKNNKINVAVHIRRPNPHDTRIEGANTPDYYYLNIINIIRTKYINNNNCLVFHIYSQGNEESFNNYKNDDTILHINEDVCKTFLGLVAANILVTSSSSFSYCAALLSDGEIYYKQFWHTPRKDWINCG